MLFQDLYEYDVPLFNPAACMFEFVSQEDSEYANPWKESFKHLYRGVHVRRGYQERVFPGRNITYFDSVQAALDHVEDRGPILNNGPDDESQGPLIFLHTGTYTGEFLVIDTDVSLIGTWLV